ncbi:hypothetical protein CASFOL_000816 [Castilleja foliolosa]|uniref:Uncharacterized protein n=1 Tax=Castilleja foliolosa TaxID=1961234 RepID=A0ABD3EPJ7_9LAMI
MGTDFKYQYAETWFRMVVSMSCIQLRLYTQMPNTL